ncbi:MAG TPA: T9SS type A sorting domain-containing protein [Rhodothermales bacterium]|nr:T9SS type A sorting domain-containing protein [Rhodothermales bacterium]
MEVFNFQDTQICEPPYEDVQDWLASIPTLNTTGMVCSTVATEDVGDVPATFELHAAYPNPFNPSTTITYSIPQRSDVRLSVFDALGRQVRQLTSGVQPAGRYSLTVDATDLPSGVYFYTLEAERFVETRTFQILK